ncbi:flagellin [Alkalicoccus daliensis]|uniref:Flagellin n=1 Tax=Alkalicoccus daliensis TaxID=745820 RepID=A0A1H0B1Y3_9BACI|nr:flagellin [Alkalicoccus daliensis]SDN39639.1 flagellin [Alkalicoccus daliensis]
MKINNNIQALNAYRNLYQNQQSTSKNLEKLSSGLRINRAADDAAGLAISEKMRSQIRGLKMAERNAMDGISLMQTSEGALQEVHSMLQRMRELAVQAANDTNTDEDRDQLQKEIDQLKEEIDSISEKTEFNTRKLLDGSSAVLTSFPDNNSATNMTNFPQVQNANYPTGTYRLDLGASEQSVNITQTSAGINNAADVTLAGFGTDEAEGAKFGEYSVLIRDYNSETNTARVEVLDPDGLSKGIKVVDTNGEGDAARDTIGGLSIDVGKISGNGTVKASIEVKAQLTLFQVQDEAAERIRAPKTLTSVNGNFKYEGIEYSYNGNIADGEETFNLTNNSLAFQIGPNTNQDVMIDIPRMDVVTLGITNINVSSNTGANQAIFELDQAISKLSDARAKLGAVQNRMEHTINNLQVTHENLTSSESRIRDADMALEMTEFTRNNILNQSATAMLAQANQLPQGVLQLLQ